MNPGDKPRRPFGLGAYVLILIGVSVVSGLAAAAQMAVSDLPGALGTVLTLAVMAVAMAVALAACVWWWRGIDEAAREAHKWAWWWGGTAGMAVGAVLLTILPLRMDDPTSLPPGLNPGELVAAGMITILLFQVAGYTIAWAVWWLKHR